MHIAILSNVNIDPLKAKLRNEGINVWTPDGYGDIFGAFINPDSRMKQHELKCAFIIVDTFSLLADCDNKNECIQMIDDWFHTAKEVLPNDLPIYLSDASCSTAPYYSDQKEDPQVFIEKCWNTQLTELLETRVNLYLFPLGRLSSDIGYRSFFSSKFWYLGRIPHTSIAQNSISEEIMRLCKPSNKKKILVVDLDNTLWGGVIGELGSQGIILSDEHKGLIFKDVQRTIKRIQQTGIILAIVSKNNYDDAIDAFKNNTHMVLCEDDFSAIIINWERKDDNISSIADTLNLGLDSFVFLDDNPAERALVKKSLPEVEVVDFPEDISKLPSLLQCLYLSVFQQQIITDEDINKSKQYAAFSKRAALQAESSSYDSFLAGLDIHATKVDLAENLPRIVQLIGKTNQFNLTTIRYSLEEVKEFITSDLYLVYAFEITDCFGNNGVTAIAIVDLTVEPKIDTLILSCRIMGKRIEDFIIDTIETDLLKLGYKSLNGEYRPTKKNAPTKDLYDRLGYARAEEKADGTICYTIDLADKPQRKFYVKEE